MKNHEENIYVIGDVHGCYHTLLILLNKIPKSSRIIFVGDLCDRGLYTKDVIELVINNGYESVLGNHDYFMIEFVPKLLNSTFSDSEKWWFDKKIGGKKTILSYKRDMETLQKHIQWLATLPLYIEIDNFFITHGFGLPYYKKKDTKEAKTGLVNNRINDEEVWGHEWEKDWQNHPVFNVFGHTPYKQAKLTPKYCCIDTGCVYGGALSALKLGTMEIISVDTVEKDIML